ncbi:hypothetical protein A2U01_0059786 [Trifolium medium]|uniref:Uncharacterized protein n=1 Tax=Trifolium medium TaxID=97028 RepID=A0A392RPH2_9FABA|nr:hypothetical protein [Trifolium medium]
MVSVAQARMATDGDQTTESLPSTGDPVATTSPATNKNVAWRPKILAWRPQAELGALWRFKFQTTQKFI